MKPRNFFRYAFTRRAIAMWVVTTVSCGFGYWCCGVFTPSFPWLAFVRAGVVVKYIIFCSAFLIKNFIDWRKYRQHTPATPSYK